MSLDLPQAATTVVAVAGGVAAIAGGVAGLRYLLRLARRGVRWMWDTLKRVRRLTDAFLGDEEEGRPGVLDRLDSIEQRQAAIAAEMHPNGGSSLRDALNRVEAKVDTLDGRLSVVEAVAKAGPA